MSGSKHLYSEERRKKLEESRARAEKLKETAQTDTQTQQEKRPIDLNQVRENLKSKKSDVQEQAALDLINCLQGAHGFSLQRQAFRMAQEKMQPLPNTEIQNRIQQFKPFIVRNEKREEIAEKVPQVEQEKTGKLDQLKKWAGKKVIKPIEDHVIKPVREKIIPKSPDSVIAVFDLIEALNDYKGDSNGQISLATDCMRLYVASQLGVALNNYYVNKQNDVENPEKVFKENCTQIFKDTYKFLAADTSLLNAIKEVLNQVFKALHIDKTIKLKTNELDKDLQGMFKEVVQKGIEIDDSEVERPKLS